MDYKFLPLSSSKSGFEHGIKKSRESTMQKVHESDRIDFRLDFYAFDKEPVWCPWFFENRNHTGKIVMKKILPCLLYTFISVIVFLSLTGCASNMTKNIDDRLIADELYKTYPVNPADLSSDSKCQKPPAVKIVNIESRTGDYETMEKAVTSEVINPKDVMNAFVAYLENGFQKSQVKVDNHSEKILQVKMIDLKSKSHFYNFDTRFCAELTIPETGFVKYYEASENAGLAWASAAHAMHNVSRQIIDDPAIRDYILCKTGKADIVKSDKEKSFSRKLIELQEALIHGLITKEEYDLKRKELLERF